MQSRKIKFGDAEFDRPAQERIHEILRTGKNTEGEYVERFEYGFAQKFGFEHAVMTSSGTTAGEVLWMAVAAQRALRWGSGTVITPALSFVATANCIMRAGILPFFVDIEPDLNMKIPSSPLYLHSFFGLQFVANMGRMVNVANLCDYAKRNKLFFAIDACEAHGAEFGNRRVSDWSDAAIYSFYPAHIMTVCGEGGMIGTNDGELADLCRSIKSHGRPSGKIDHDFLRIGTNAKATEIAAAAGLSALDNFDFNFTLRRRVRHDLHEMLSNFPVVLYPDAPDELIAPHAFPLCVNDPELLPALRRHLDTWTIEHKPLWGALSDHGAYHWMQFPAGYFPVAESIGATGLHFGCHERMTGYDCEYIYDVFSMFFKDYREAA